MALPKFYGGALIWAPKPNHGGILMALFQPEDDTGAIHPGLSVQLEVNVPLVVDRCRYEFGLFKLEGGVRKRAYQIAVTPKGKRSHNSPSGTIYGPHEHIGDQVSAVVADEIECGNMEPPFVHFCRRINLTFTGKANFPI